MELSAKLEEALHLAGADGGAALRTAPSLAPPRKGARCCLFARTACACQFRCTYMTREDKKGGPEGTNIWRSTVSVHPSSPAAFPPPPPSPPTPLVSLSKKSKKRMSPG